MPQPDSVLLAELREFSKRYQRGRKDAPLAFRDLASRILHLTILRIDAQVRLTRGPRGSDIWILGGASGATDPLPLNDGRYLRVSISLFRERYGFDYRLKVRESSFQYQEDREGQQWIFRYDYIRTPPAPYPAAHLQIRGNLLEENCLPYGMPLSRIPLPH